MSDTTPDIISWDVSIETMLANWCDEAKCFEWMHTAAYDSYDSKSKCLTITSNIISAIAGLLNVIAGNQVVNGFQFIWAVGSLSIVISILNMIQEKMAYASLASDFRAHSMTWGIIRRKIEEELAIPIISRKSCGTFLHSIRQDINQVSLAGNSKIPQLIRDQCYTKFKVLANFEIPEICGNMAHTTVYSLLESSPTLALLDLSPSHTRVGAKADHRSPHTTVVAKADHRSPHTTVVAEAEQSPTNTVVIANPVAASSDVAKAQP